MAEGIVFGEDKNTITGNTVYNSVPSPGIKIIEGDKNAVSGNVCTNVKRDGA